MGLPKVTQLFSAVLCAVLCLVTPWTAHGVSLGKNTGVSCHALLQGIFQPRDLNPGLLHCRQILYHLSHQGSPFSIRIQTVASFLLI